jgi:hypothetical protein
MRAWAACVALGLSGACASAAPSEPVTAASLSPELVAAAYCRPAPPECAGSHVDLADISRCVCLGNREPFTDDAGHTMMSARTTCGAEIEGRDVRGSLDLGVSVVPETLRAGDEATIVARITNREADPVPVVFADRVTLRGPRLVDAAGRDVTDSGDCWTGEGSTPRNYMIVLQPHGVAELRIPWRAATRDSRASTDADGSPRWEVSWQPLAAGDYRAEVYLSVPGLPVDARKPEGHFRVP